MKPDPVFTMKQCNDCMLGFNEKGQVVPGKGYTNATLMVVGERPSYGKTFCGQKDKILRKSINAFMGIADDRLFFTSMIKCNTDEEQEVDRKLYKAAVTACDKHLQRQIELVDPILIFLVGRPTTLSVLGLPQKITMKSLMNKVYEKDGHNYWVIWSPGYLIRNERKFKPWKKNLLRARECFNKLVNEKYPEEVS